MIKLIDFDHGCGGLTAGMERYGEFLVVDNVYLNQNNEYCYNNTHINPFWVEAHVSESYYSDLNIKIACFSPNISRSSKKSIDLSDFSHEAKWINTFHPEVVIFSLQPEVILHLNSRNINNPYTSDGWPFFDMLLDFFHSNDYEQVQYFTINYLDYNIPINKRHGFYVAWNNDKKLKLYYPKIDNRKKVIDALSKVDNNLNDIWHKPNFKYSNNCSYITPGSKASKNKDIDINYGYLRLAPNRISPKLYKNFYLPSSKGPSIHPIEDRPLTIREGAFLNGLDYTFTWDNKVSKTEVSSMIVNSVSPIIGYYFAQSIFNLVA